MLTGDIPVSLRLEQWRPGIGRRLFAQPESVTMPAWPGTVLRQLSLPRLESLLDGMALTGVVPSCARAVRSRQLAHLAGRLCGEAALQALSGRCHAVGQLPDGAPCWPAGVLGSIAHDAHGALAVVAHCRDYRWLGIDVEPVLDEPACQAVRDVCLTAHERELLMASSWPIEEATVRFSAKEAYYKAVYPVLGGQMDFLDVELAPLTPGSPQFRVVPASSPALRAELPVLEGHFVIDDGRVFTGIAG
jgi:enterobactin synthetase component D